jgi:ABC-type polysaccharide/polyol phosphate transport system ATPase subunit
MDEVFVSGDIDFQNKTLSTINNLQKSKGLTTLVCSHVPRLILTVADKFYKLEKGRISKGSRNDILRAIRKRDRFWSNNIINNYK